MRMTIAELNTQIHALRVAIKVARAAGNHATLNMLERLLPRFEIALANRATAS